MASKSPAKKASSKTKKQQTESDPSVSYDEWKFFEGQFYTEPVTV